MLWGGGDLGGWIAIEVQVLPEKDKVIKDSSQFILTISFGT